ncbi:hypothetical protein ACHAXR_006150 [Thalassiosira sp. AJA248-18]
MFRTKTNQRLPSDGESNKQQRHIFLAVVVVAILFLMASLLEPDSAAPPQDLAYSLDADENHRRLAETRNSGAHFAIPVIKPMIFITVHLAGARNMAISKSGNSIFQTDTLPKYGSGRVQFLINENAECDYSCNADTHQQPRFLADNHYAPCLAVGRDYSSAKCLHEHLKCNYPTCKTMVTMDEHCDNPVHDVRMYFSSDIPNSVYLPSGPRYDAWTSFQMIQSSPYFYFKQASKRKYAFNAIFSQGSNEGRKRLAQLIEEQQNKTALPTFTNVAKKWTSNVNNPRMEQLHTDSYMNALLDSVFTLSPAGRNPECHRMFEAVEAGSIPVLVKSDLYNEVHQCKGALHHWYDAPILVLESWDDLYTTVESVMGDLDALDEMQRKLRTWYDEYMRKVIWEFEDFMLDSYGLGESIRKQANRE